MAPGPRLQVLVLARNYPNNVMPTLGLWTQRLVLASSRLVDPTVIAPVPYAPPLLPIEAFTRFRRVAARRRDAGYDVFHPRVPFPPGHALHRFEAALIWPTVRRLADRLHEERRFDLIHAHFIYPDGVLAARLGRRYGLPVVTTEGAPWRPWFDDYPAVRAQVLRALASVRLVLPVSTSLERNIVDAMGGHVTTRVVHNVVDEATFTPSETEGSWDPDQLLFVGVIRRVKGLDILVRAFATLARRRPTLRLLVIGAAFYRGYQRDEDEVRRLVGELGLAGRIRFAGQSSPAEVAAAMQRSALLVVPSRRETFSAVTAEAIASGTPVVATRCGGPEDIITPENGRLVPSEDPEALARAIDEMLGLRAQFDRRALHADMVARFGMQVTAARLAKVYGDVLGRTLAS
ncbi:MAG: glycosyltransferase [Betaproteobacteria bacterium]|nr:glycosyltransferase [Betaproteobacteria bacterium]